MIGLLKGLGYTLKNLTREKVTYDYPNEPLPLQIVFVEFKSFIRKSVLFVINVRIFVRRIVFN